MNPYLPFAAIPIAVAATLFASTKWSFSDPGRYRVPSVNQIEEPKVPVTTRSHTYQSPDVRVAAFLPHVPPRPPAPTPDLVLHSVMTGTQVHLATINGQVVKKGDEIAGYKVARITAEGVDLTAANNTRHLPMRSLHELPPPVERGVDPVQKQSARRHDSDALTENFWSTFDSNPSQM